MVYIKNTFRLPKKLQWIIIRRKKKKKKEEEKKKKKKKKEKKEEEEEDEEEEEEEKKRRRITREDVLVLCEFWLWDRLVRDTVAQRGGPLR